MLATQSPNQEYQKEVELNNLTSRVAFRNMSKSNNSSALGVAELVWRDSAERSESGKSDTDIRRNTVEHRNLQS